MPLDIKLQDIIKTYFTSLQADAAFYKDALTVTHIEFFLYRRAEILYQVQSFSGGTESTSGFPLLMNRIKNEFTVVKQYCDTKIGTLENPGTLFNSPVACGPIPAHLDLDDLARQRTVDSAGDPLVIRRASYFKQKRFERALCIAWRAAAIQQDLWETPGVNANILKQEMLQEYIDRRLRIVERINYNVAATSNSGGENFTKGYMPPRIKSWNPATAPKGPWNDGLRVRIFEYPRMPSSYVPAFAPVTAPDLDPTHDDPSQPETNCAEPHWKARQVGTEWRILPIPNGTHPYRFPPALRDHIKPFLFSGDTYDIQVTPQAPKKGMDIIDDLFKYADPATQAPLKANIWDRAWINCDHVLSLCQIEALLFGLRRRFQQAGETMFNGLVDGTGLPPHPQDYKEAQRPYVVISAHMQTKIPYKDPAFCGVRCINKTLEGCKVYSCLLSGRLMNHYSDPHFENIWINKADLQIGDQVILWNSSLYTLFHDGVWALENSVVMETSSHAQDGVNLNSLKLQGHGIGILSLSQYQTDTARKLGVKLTALQNRLQTASGNQFFDNKVKIIRWSPYKKPGSNGTLVDETPTAWWIEIPMTSVQRGTEISELLQSIPKSVGKEENPGVNYNPSPNPNTAVYFPLREPQITCQLADGTKASGWPAYFEKRRQTQTVPVKLTNIKADGSLVPGLFIFGNDRIPVIRPKAKM